MKSIYVVLLLFLYISITAQQVPLKLVTAKYAGYYHYGKNIEKERIGSITIYPETDSTILFYLQLNRGGPSYNMGQLYGRLKPFADTAIFYDKADFTQTACWLKFKFEGSQLVITTLQRQDDCGFGAWVYADGIYKCTTHKIIDNFIGLEGDTIYFNVPNSFKK